MSGARMSIGDLPPRYQAEIERQLAKGKPLGLARAEQVRAVQVEPVAPMLRQKRTPALNKWELAFGEQLRRDYPNAHVSAQSITLKLANGVRYTPDFIVAGGPSADVIAYEVKGYMRDDAAVKLKVAATAFPWMRFVLARRDGQRWVCEEVLP